MRKLHRIVVTAAVAIGALVAGFAVLGTPGSDGVARAGGDSLQVVAGEFFFSPGTLTADADTDFTVTLTNNGGILHNFTIDVGGFPATGNAPGGGTTSETFNLAAGSYDYFCSIGGHRGAGMEGTITITAAPSPSPPPPTPPPPTPQPPEPTDETTSTGATSAPTSISLGAVKLVRTGRRPLQVQASVTCNGSNGPCRLTLLVKARVGKRLLAAKPKKKTVTLSKKRFVVAEDSTRTFKTRLSKPGRKVFKRIKRLRRVTVVLRGRDAAGPIRKVTQRVTLTVPAQKP